VPRIASGRLTVMVVPRPGSLSTSIVPAWFFTMSRVTARPGPVPLPSGLVVKNDSKIFSRCSSAIPVPVFGHPRRHVRDVLDPADLDAHGEPTSTRHRVGGVGDQVDEDLRELITIAQHRRIRLVQDLDGLDALDAELVRHQDQCALDHLADVHRLDAGRAATGEVQLPHPSRHRRSVDAGPVQRKNFAISNVHRIRRL